MPYKTVLPARDIQAGSEILALLEKAGVPIQAAFWHYMDERESWYLMIVSPSVGAGGPLKLYRLLTDLAKNSPNADSLSEAMDRTTFSSERSLDYQAVKRGVGLRTARGEPRDLYVEDAYIYKI